MRVPREVVDARRQRLADLLARHGYLPVRELAERLRVSAATLRRDLALLARQRRITRTHGGALAEFNARFPSFLERQRVAAPGKREIARRAAGLLQPGQVVFLDSGTTVHAIAERLRAAPPAGSLTCVTNSLPVASLLAEVPGCESVLCGGELLHRQSALLGDAARRAVRLWQFDLALLSAEGMDAEGLSNSTTEVAAFQRTVVGQARQAVFCLDRSKLGRRAPAALLPWERIAHLLTDCDHNEAVAAGVPGRVLSVPGPPPALAEADSGLTLPDALL